MAEGRLTFDDPFLSEPYMVRFRTKLLLHPEKAGVTYTREIVRYAED